MTKTRERSIHGISSRKRSNNNGAEDQGSEMKTVAQKKFVEICTKKHAKPNETVVKSLGMNNFFLAADEVDLEELNLCADFLKRFTTVEKVSIRVRNAPMNRATKTKLERSGLDEPPIKSAQGAMKLIRSVASMLSKSTKLLQLNLIGIKIPPSSIKSLAKGLSACESITSLNLSHSELGDESFEILSGPISRRPHLAYLNLSHCKLTDKSRRGISQIVRVNGIRRDDQFWCTSLRDRTPRVRGAGLILLEAAYNELGDETVELLCDVLAQDKWLVGIKMDHNALTPRSIVAIAELFQSNITLLMFDISNSSNADGRLTEFIEHITAKRRPKIAAAISASSDDPSLLCRILITRWKLAREYVPIVAKKSFMDDDHFSNEDEEAQFAFDESDSETLNHPAKESFEKPPRVFIKNSVNSMEMDGLRRRPRTAPIKRIMSTSNQKISQKQVISAHEDAVQSTHKANVETIYHSGHSSHSSSLRHTSPRRLAFETMPLSSIDHYESADDPQQCQSSSQSAEWATDLMERMRAMEETQFKSQLQMTKLLAENQELRHQLEDYEEGRSNRSNKTMSSASESSKPLIKKKKKHVVAKLESALINQLQQSISSLTNQVSQLESSQGRNQTRPIKESSSDESSDKSSSSSSSSNSNSSTKEAGRAKGDLNILSLRSMGSFTSLPAHQKKTLHGNSFGISDELADHIRDSWGLDDSIN